MKTLFISQDLWDLVEKGYLEIAVSADTLKELRKKDAKALFFIQQAVAESIFPRIAAAMLGLHYIMGIKVMPRY